MSRYLLDTHTLIWFLEDNPSLSTKAKSRIEDLENDILVSLMSLWEISIKISVGKLKLAFSFDQFIKSISKGGFSFLYLETTHILFIETLPFHHKDPFDRMLIAQGITENLPIISKDGRFDAYSVERVW